MLFKEFYSDMMLPIHDKSNTLTFYVNWFQITHQDAEQYGFKLKNKDGTGAPIEAAYEVSKDSMQLHTCSLFTTLWAPVEIWWICIHTSLLERERDSLFIDIGLFTKSNLTEVEYYTKHVHFTNVKHI